MPKKAQAAERVPFLDLKAQLRAVEPDVRAALDRTLASADFVLGAAVERFEKEFARFCGAAHAVGVSSGLDALRLALTAAGVGPGDEVVVPASTYIATALAVSSAGANVVLADCDPGTWNLCPRAFKKAVTKRTKAVIAVHLAGQPANMSELGELARRRGVAVIEDAAHAAGASYQGKRAGALGLLGCFSFYPTKNLGALGDGGCVTTGDGALAARLRRLRNYGQRLK
jgi:dTDP-4-amino-4,6-dideoxygalactose transaminase